MDELTERQRNAIIYGSGSERIRFAWENESGSRGEYYRTWEGLASEIRRRYMQSGSDAMREYYTQYMSEQPCPDCEGRACGPKAWRCGWLDAQSAMSPA